MANVCNTLLPSDKVHEILAEIGEIVNPTPVTDRVIENEVAPIMTTESTHSKLVFKVL